MRRDEPGKSSAPEATAAIGDGFGAKIRVLLADDYPLLRIGIRTVIDRDPNLAVCGTAGNPGETLEVIAALKPHVVVVAFSLENAATFALMQDARVRQPHAPLLILSFNGNSTLAERAFRSGAKGFMAMTDAAEDVAKAVCRLARGLTYVGTRTGLPATGQLFDATARRSGSGTRAFTNRERQILELTGVGLTPREISETLRVSLKTVESHRENIKQKLGIKNVAKLALYAFQWLQDRKTSEKGA